MERQKIILQIKQLNPFYSGCTFEGHTDEQLLEILDREIVNSQLQKICMET